MPLTRKQCIGNRVCNGWKGMKICNAVFVCVNDSICGCDENYEKVLTGLDIQGSITPSVLAMSVKKRLLMSVQQ